MCIHVHSVHGFAWFIRSANLWKATLEPEAPLLVDVPSCSVVRRARFQRTRRRKHILSFGQSRSQLSSGSASCPGSFPRNRVQPVKERVGLCVYVFCPLRVCPRPCSQVSEDAASDDPCACRRFAQCRALQQLGRSVPVCAALEPKPLHVHFQFAEAELERLTRDIEPKHVLPVSRCRGRKLSRGLVGGSATLWKGSQHRTKLLNLATCLFGLWRQATTMQTPHEIDTKSARKNLQRVRASGTNVPGMWFCSWSVTLSGWKSSTSCGCWTQTWSRLTCAWLSNW